MRNIFKNNTLQEAIETKGYVQLPLLDAQEISRLASLCNRHISQYSQPFHTTHFSTNLSYKQEVNNLIIEIVFPKIAPYLNNYKPIFGNFMMKAAKGEYYMPVHADWVYADENQFRSLAIWIPLVDTGENNGCLGVIEGSQFLTGKIRGPRITINSGDNNENWIKQLGKLLPAKAGDAIIYDHGLLHFSPPNKSAALRPALNLAVVPAEAEMIHYCIPEGATDIEVYKVPDMNFYLHYNNFQRPETNSLTGTLPANTAELMDGRMNLFQQERTKKPGLLSRLFGV